jgi:1-acyl-sn-glycerol-3-phosphate acyltransferase
MTHPGQFDDTHPCRQCHAPVMAAAQSGLMNLAGTLRITRMLGAVIMMLIMAVPWLVMPARWPLRRRWEAAAWAILLAGIGVRLDIRGRRASGGLLAANHMSWLDIAVMARSTRGRFVAKAEVGGWPVIGGLARRHGAIFVTRGRRADLGGQLAEFGNALLDDAPLILFPEGTTGPGTHLLAFRSSLLAVAVGRNSPVQPVAIRYCRRDGSPLCARMRRKVAWLGEDALLPHALALAAEGGLGAELCFLPPVTSHCRKDLAERLRMAIAAELGIGVGAPAPLQAATLNRAA